MDILPVSMGPDSLHLQRLSDEGPGADQRVFALMKWVGNGLAVQTWDVRLITPSSVSPPHELADFPTLSHLTRPVTGGACRLLSGKWVSGSEPERGNGLQLVATWMDIRNGQWAASQTLPTLHRRCLFRFESARIAARGTAVRRPLRWYAHADTRTGLPEPERRAR